MVFLLAAAGIQSASAADYYVDIKSGNDAAGDGSVASPWKTFHYAVSNLVATDILHVAPGYYNLANGESDAALNAATADITIQADEPGAVIDGAGAANWVNGLNIIAVTNIRISGLFFHNFGNAGVYFQNLPGTCYVTDCRFQQNEMGIQISNGAPVIERNRFYLNTMGISVMGVSGFIAASPEIRNNLIVGQAVSMFGIKITAVTVDILAPAAASPLIQHNTIDSGSETGIYINKDPDSTAMPDIRFNIITNFSQYGVENINGSPAAFNYNNLWNNAGGNYWGIAAGTDDISADPDYMLDGEKYYLQSTSPCINLIPSNADPVTEDLRRRGRPLGSQKDLGCFEIVEPFMAPGTYYVDIVNGSDQLTSGAAPASGAFRTLHYALERINTGNPGGYTLNVAAGTYSAANGEDTKWLEINRNNLLIQGPAPPQSAVIDGLGGVRWSCGMAVNAASVTVSGLIFQRFNRAGLIAVNSSPLISRNQFIGNNTGVIVEGDNADVSPKIINNLIWGGGANAMTDGIVVNSSVSAGPYIYFNTLANGSESGIVITGTGGAAPPAPEIKYNIISHFGNYGIQNINGSFTPNYNNLYGNVTAAYTGVSAGANDISVQPLYISTSDFHLQTTSACIDTIPNGTTFPSDLISQVGQDLDGTVRPVPSGGSYDMGCYESAGASLSVTVTISPADGGGITDDFGRIACPGVCTGSYSNSDILSLTAAPAAGYRLDHWEEGGQTVSTANPMVFTLTTDHAVTAVFTAAHTAGDYYVNIGTGSDATGDGSAAAPWKTLHHALPQLIATDTLHVAPGYYNTANGEADQALEITVDNLTIQGDGPGVVIDGSGAADWLEGLRISARQSIRLTGLDFIHFSTAAVVFQDLTGKCLITDCNLSGNAIGVQAGNADPSITSNTFFNNTYGIFVQADSGTAGKPFAPEIWNNLIYGQGGMQYGIKVETFSTNASLAPSIYHNTIDTGSETGIYLYAEAGVVAPDIRFNIITNFSQYGISNTNGTPTALDYNDIWNSGVENYLNVSPGSNDISVNPLFRTDAQRYYLQSGSPCINRIPADSHPVTVDRNGTSRPQGALIDMGCFEAAAAAVGPGAYYVDAVNGSDQNTSGTSPGAGAFRSLHYALNLINSGDPGEYSLYVAPGTYSVANGENDDLLEVNQNNLTIKAYPEPFSAVIEGQGGTRWTSGMIINAQNVTISGFLFRHFSQSGLGVKDAGPLVFQNRFIDNNFGMVVHGDRSLAAPSIFNNLFQGETAGGMKSAIMLYAVGTGTNEALIYFNTMDSGTDNGVVIENNGTAAAPEIKYNIITAFGQYGLFNNGGSPLLDYNDVYGNLAADYSGLNPGPNDLSVSPLYQDALDRHLQSTSACIDTIPNNMALPAHLSTYLSQDLDGNPRPAPLGGDYDMGCYEQSSAASVTLTIAVWPDGAGSVTDDKSQINCPGDCDGSYAAAESITLQATPNSGYLFDHWEENTNIHTTNPMTFIITATQTGKAVFKLEEGANQPPNAPTAANPLNGAHFAANTSSVTLTAGDYSDPENDPHAETYWLVRRQDRGVYNCEDYDPSFNAVVAEGPGLTAHTISGLETGMQYVWKVGYKDAGSNGVSWSEEYAFTVGDSAVDREVIIPAGADPLNYRMVSFPVWPDNSDCLAAFRNSFTDGLYDTRYVRLGTYVPALGSYAECADNLIIRPGQAYWILAREGLSVNFSGIPVTRRLDLEMALAYEPVSQDGWNMVACPNLAVYDWADIQVLESDGQGGIVYGPEAISALTVDNPYIDLRLWRWENGAYADDTTRMAPHTGYWVKAKKANLMLKFPETAQRGLLSGLAVSAPMADSKKQAAAKTEEEDKEDSPPPPMGVSVKVKSNGLSAKGGCFIEVMTPTGSTGDMNLVY